MAVDGSLIFNTKIDTDGFDKGTKDVSSKVADLKNKISSTDAAVKNLQAELKKTANTKVKTKVAEGLERDLAKAKEQLREYYAEADRIGDAKQAELKDLGFNDAYLDKALAQDKAWQQVQEKIAKAETQAKRYAKALEQANAAAPFAKDTADFQKKQQRLDDLSGQLDVYRLKLREALQAEQAQSSATSAAADRLAAAKRHLERTITALKLFSKGAAKAGNALRTAFSKTAGKMISNIGSHFRRANASTNILEKSIKRIKNTLVRMFFFRLVHSPIDAVKDGLGEIAKVSPEVNRNLSALKTESTYLKNTLAALAAPLVNLVTPAFTRFMQAVSGVTEQAGQLIAALTRQSYTKAVRQQQDYAASLDDSTKAADKNTKALENNQHALAGFDELNVLEQNDAAGSDSEAAAASPLFQAADAQTSGLAKHLLDALKQQDFEAVGKYIGDKINSGLRKINWNSIKSTAKKWAGNIAGFFNGFIQKTDWRLVGATVGEGIQTAFAFSLTFLERLDWNRFGKSVGRFFGGAFKKIKWKDVGKTFAAVFNGLFQATGGFLSAVDWKSAGAAMRTMIVTVLQNVDWNTAAYTLVHLFNSCIGLALTLLGNPDFSLLGGNIADALQDMLTNINWEGVGALFTTLLVGALDFTGGLVLSVDWNDFGKKLADSFNRFFGEGGGLRFVESVGTTIGNIVFGISDLIIGFFEDPKSADAFAAAVERFFTSIPWVKIIIKSITGGIEIGTWIIQGVTKLVEDFCKALADGFSGAGDDPELKAAVQGLGKALANLFIGVLNSLIGIVVTAIPNIFIGLIKGILSALSWALQLILGEDFYKQSMQTLDNWKGYDPKNVPKIPYLATGTVIPANYGEFLAVLGDNKREAQVVSPVSAMKQAFLEALAEGNFSGGDGEKEINLYIDGDKFFTWLIGKSNRYQKAHGYPAFQGVE